MSKRLHPLGGPSFRDKHRFKGRVSSEPGFALLKMWPWARDQPAPRHSRASVGRLLAKLSESFVALCSQAPLRPADEARLDSAFPSGQCGNMWVWLKSQESGLRRVWSLFLFPKGAALKTPRYIPSKSCVITRPRVSKTLHGVSRRKHFLGKHAA